MTLSSALPLALALPLCQSTEAPSQWLATFQVNRLSGGGSGNFTVLVQPGWAPVGARRFRRLLEEGVFRQSRFFRVIKGFAAQFGIPGDPKTASKWRRKVLADDIVRVTNRRGRLSYAASGADSRTTQVFVNLVDNRHLDKAGFAPFAEVVDGMDVIDSLYGRYGEGPPHGKGPDQRRIQREGNSYLDAEFPLLSYIEAAEQRGSWGGSPASVEEEESELLFHAVPLLVGFLVLSVALILFARVCCRLKHLVEEVPRKRVDDEENESKDLKPRPQRLPGGDDIPE